MRLILFFLLILCLQAAARPLQKTIDTKKMQEQLDSSNTRLQRSLENSKKQIDSLNMARFSDQNQRSLNAFMAEQREREKKQKMGLWLRFGFVAVMLAVAYAGFKRKKNNSDS